MQGPGPLQDRFEGLFRQPKAHHNGTGNGDKKDPVARTGITVGFHKSLIKSRRVTSPGVGNFLQAHQAGMVPFVIYAVTRPRA